MAEKSQTAGMDAQLEEQEAQDRMTNEGGYPPSENLPTSQADAEILVNKVKDLLARRMSMDERRALDAFLQERKTMYDQLPQPHLWPGRASALTSLRHFDTLIGYLSSIKAEFSDNPEIPALAELLRNEKQRFIKETLFEGETPDSWLSSMPERIQQIPSMIDYNNFYDEFAERSRTITDVYAGNPPEYIREGLVRLSRLVREKQTELIMLVPVGK